MPSMEGKSDMERIGVFKEMSYISIGDKYTPVSNRKHSIYLFIHLYSCL